MSFIPVILCGGNGSRLFPLSKKNYPKQFLRLTNEFSLLQNTILRFKDYKKIILISNVNFKNLIINHINELIFLNLINKNINIEILLEPIGRNTCPAISIVCNLFNKDKLLFLPCDHIYDDSKFIETINKINLIEKDLIIFGIKATYPETEYGYIEFNDKTNEVLKFIEKPNYETAKIFISQNKYYWNSGIFYFNAIKFNELLKIYDYEMYNNINNIDLNIITEDQYKFIYISDEYKSLKDISIDNGLIELIPVSDIYMISYDGLWNDIGSFKRLYDISDKDENYINKNSNYLSLSSNNCLIKSDKNILLNNVKNLVIVETKENILVSDINSTNKIKEIYNKSSYQNNNIIDFRPWGFFEILYESNNIKIKKISVYPNKKLSLQSHLYRFETWTCINGKGIALIDNNEIELITNKTVSIDKQIKHRLINNSDKNLLEIIEIQEGEYLGEDDIIRYEDDFNRI